MEDCNKSKTHDSGLNLNPLCSRRQTLKWGGMTIAGLSALGPLLARGATSPFIIMEQAEGLVVADPVLCVGCGRCELACTEFNEGWAAPSLSRIKVGRNLNFGSAGASSWREGHGNWGDGLIIQDLCKQCPHPAPCANICPKGAIVAGATGKARLIDLNKCTGCKVCLKACPWEMISYDPNTQRATKCHLCGGKPKCVEACPSGALSFVKWIDLTDKIPPRDAGAWKRRQPFSLQPFISRWIDVIGTIGLAAAGAFVVIHGIMRKAVKR
jgi:Fe-S-cluster-containing dehydrogenase component